MIRHNVRLRLASARRARVRVVAGLAAVALAAAACGGAGVASSAPTGTPVATATPAAPTASPSQSAPPTASPAPAATPASATVCTSQPPTSASSGWTKVTGQDGDYTYSEPADWVPIPSVTFPLDITVSPETFAATGLPAATKINVDVATTPDRTAGITAWTLDKVNIPTERLFGTELAWLKTRTGFKTVVDDSLTACIDGSTARGFQFTWAGRTTDDTWVIYSLSRNGKMYQIQMTTPVGTPTATLDELIRTWKWTHAETPAPAASGGSIDDQIAATKFAAFGTASELDQTGDHPNPATFKSVFPAKTPKIYFIYELDDGVADTVEITWSLNGVKEFDKAFDYTTKTSFGWFYVTPDRTGFKPGTYEVTATLKNAGDHITVLLTVQ